MIRATKGFLKLVGLALLSQLAVSCGLIDFEFDEEVLEAYDMSLDRDTVYVMVGDSFCLSPVFSPDTVSNREIYLESSADSIISIVNDTIVARSSGQAYVTAVSVQHRIADSCVVNVIDRWQFNPADFSQDMVLYLRPSIGGESFDPSNMMLGAFCGNELRGIAQLRTWNGTPYLLLRVYADYNYEGDPIQPDLIRFGIYDRRRLLFYYLDKALSFDGETHGTLNSLLEL